MLARSVVPPTPPRSSHPRRLLSCQYFVPVNPLGATLIGLPASVANKRFNVLAKLFRCNTYKKHGGGLAIMVKQALQTSHPPSCPPSVSPRLWGCCIFHSPYTLPSSVSRKSFACHSYENTGGVGVFFPFWNNSFPSVLQCLPGRSSLNASSTGAAMISRTRSRSAGTSSLVSPLVSMVSCR